MFGTINRKEALEAHTADNWQNSEWAKAETPQWLHGAVSPPHSGGFRFDGIREISMHVNHPNDLEPIEPSVAQEMYLDQKANNCVETTVNSHRYRTIYFVQWCEETRIDNLNDLTGRSIHQFRMWRDEVGDLNRVSLQTQLCTIRVYLKFCASIDAVDVDLPGKIIMPTLKAGENQRDEMFDADRAQEILGHLSKYQCASREHVLLAFLWETGMRIGGANSLDVSDVVFDERFLKMRHRPQEGTTLKNGNEGNRLVAITPSSKNCSVNTLRIPAKTTPMSMVETHCSRAALAG